MIPTIETDRLILRGPKPEDLPVYESFFADEKHRQLMADRFLLIKLGGF